MVIVLNLTVKFIWKHSFLIYLVIWGKYIWTFRRHIVLNANDWIELNCLFVFFFLVLLHRLTTKWMVNLCMQYITPSLEELMTLHCHGPIGWVFKFDKFSKKNPCPIVDVFLNFCSLSQRRLFICQNTGTGRQMWQLYYTAVWTRIWYILYWYQYKIVSKQLFFFSSSIHIYMHGIQLCVIYKCLPFRCLRSLLI